MSDPHDDNQAWAPCPPGTLRTAAASMQAPAVETRRRFLTGVATGVVVAAIGLGAVSARQFFFPPHIACSECQALLPRFVGQDLPTDLAARVQRHLSDCLHCRTIYDSLRGAVSQHHEADKKSLPRLVAWVQERTLLDSPTRIAHFRSTDWPSRDWASNSTRSPTTW